MKNKTRNTTILSIATLICAAIVATGATYALFTKEVKVNNHIEAGSLNIGLKRTSYKELVLDETTGLLKENTNSDVVDLTTDGTKLFNLKVVPQAYATATIEVSNLGNVAFDYGVRTLWTMNEDLKPLADQLEITISKAGDANTIYKKYKLSESTLTTNDYKFQNSLLVNKTFSFDVTAKFLDHKDNNLAQGKKVDFDLQVFASQKTY